MRPPWLFPLARRVAGAIGLAALAVTGGLLLTAAPNALAKTRADTALPPGWEMCILQGIGASVTPANVNDLDVWQQAEGGATANPEAFNPFNTRRGTDQAEASLPASWTSGGFPSFHTWTAGCAATVATILQPNMTAIAGALGSGDVSPPAAFLATVDQTPWCAPSNGVPCYSDQITGGAPATSSSDAMSLLHDATTTLTSYDQDAVRLAGAQQKVADSRQRLSVADIAVSLAHYGAQRAADALRSYAISDYTSNPSLQKMAAAVEFQASSESDMLAQYYTSLGSSMEVDRYQAAQAVLGRADSARAGAAATVAEDVTSAQAAQSATDGSVGKLAINLVSLRTAGACLPPGTTPPGAPAPPASSSSPPTPTTSTTSTTSTTTTTTTTTTVLPKGAAVPGASGSDPPVVATIRGCLASLAS